MRGSAAVRTSPLTGVVSIGDCEIEAELVSDEGYLVGVDVRFAERDTRDVVILEADEPEDLERVAALLMVKAQELRDARAARKVVPA